MAERTEIAHEIEALAVHCKAHLMTHEARALWLRDWCEDLREFPIEHIRIACRQWRQGGKTKFPTPGELLPMVRAQKREERAPAEQPWREISDAEYERLPLRSKIEHQRILANLARRKAGPMWVNGRPAGPEELPESWHVWTKRAENHEAEAARLQRFMRHPQAAAVSQ